PILLMACGSKGSDLTLTVSGVAMADVEKIKADLSGLKGVSDAKAGQFKDGQVVLTLKSEGKGSDLASRLATLGSGLKNVKGFDDASVQVSYDGVAAVAPPKPADPEPP